MRWPVCGGSKLPPRSPIRTDQRSGGLRGLPAVESGLAAESGFVAESALAVTRSGTPPHVSLTRRSLGYRCRSWVHSSLASSRYLISLYAWTRRSAASYALGAFAYFVNTSLKYRMAESNAFRRK